MNTREQDLAAALLWLRNHYEYMADTPERLSVLQIIDDCLNDGDSFVPGAVQDTFRQKYIRPRALKGAGTS